MRAVLNIAGFGLLFVFLCSGRAQDISFTNSLVAADNALECSDIPRVLTIYADAEKAQTGNASNLCVLAHRYCDLTYLTNSSPFNRDLVALALACSQQAVSDAPTNATAHTSLAVCYAQSCNFSDTKTKLANSRLFKLEAEKALALDPNQDIAYYLLGRWNYGIASQGWMSRAYVKMIYGGLPQASYADAVRDFQKACRLAPGRILNHAGLAMAYDAVGEKKMEIMELEKCFALKPLGPEDTEALRDAKKKLASLQ
jgi:Flp pilus assembly protein TadD